MIHKIIFGILALLVAVCSLSSCGDKKPPMAQLGSITTTAPLTSPTSPTTPEVTTTSENAAQSTPADVQQTTTSQTTTTQTTTTPPETTTTTDFANTITLLGSNTVYVGETFDYSYFISHKNADRATVMWSATGKGGELSSDGRFTATEAGEMTLTVTDVSNGLTDSLTVYCIDSPDDVKHIVEVNGIPIANKTYPVPEDYYPGDVLPEVWEAFLALKEAADSEGLYITFESGFRSYEEQKQIYHKWYDKYNENANLVSARPGHSEHQLGLAIDVNELEYEFADTDEGKWLKENCYKFGFIIRYPSFESQAITGYNYEPWHIRYLGEALAFDVHFSGLTLEEYLGIDSYYRSEYKYQDELPTEEEPEE